jgi:hypothetical protein
VTDIFTLIHRAEDMAAQGRWPGLFFFAGPAP